MLSASQSEKTSLSAVAVSPTTSPPSLSSTTTTTTTTKSSSSSSSSQSDSKPVTFTPSAFPTPHTSPVSPTHRGEACPPLPASASPALITDSSIDQSTSGSTHSDVDAKQQQPQPASSANLSASEPVSSSDEALISSPSMYVSIMNYTQFMLWHRVVGRLYIYLRLRISDHSLISCVIPFLLLRQNLPLPSPTLRPAIQSVSTPSPPQSISLRRRRRI